MPSDPYSEGRAFAVVGGDLPKRLIASARKKNVVDLSLALADELPVSSPGRGVGNHRQPYMTIRFGMNPNTKTSFVMHMMDSHAGTHLVPPAYALPPKGFENKSYAPEVREWLLEYEGKFGPRGTSDVTTEQVPLSQTCGRSRIVDVKHLMGLTRKEQWPVSPEITALEIQKFEKEQGELKPGEIVIFRSDWSDQHYRPLPAGTDCWDNPLNGRCEGWPAPGPEAIHYLAEKKIRCVATDSPNLGGVEPKRALQTYWALGSKNMVGVEFLAQVGKLPKDAYFMFAAVKVKDCHGGPGRAIGLY